MAEPGAGAGRAPALNGEAAGLDTSFPEAPRGARVLAFVNGMGGTPQTWLDALEALLAESDRAVPAVRGGRAPAARRRDPVRNLVGSHITSLEMAGASLTLLELDDELVSLWDAPVHTPALRWGA